MTHYISVGIDLRDEYTHKIAKLVAEAVTYIPACQMAAIKKEVSTTHSELSSVNKKVNRSWRFHQDGIVGEFEQCDEWYKSPFSPHYLAMKQSRWCVVQAIYEYELLHDRDQDRYDWKGWEKFYRLMPKPLQACISKQCGNLDCLWTFDVPLRTCTRCGVVKYCSKGCQKMNWPSHKRACKAFKD